MTRPKTRTRPGLGESEGVPRIDTGQVRRARPESSPADPALRATGRNVRASLRREEDPEPASVRSDRPSARTPSWEPEATTGTRRRRPSRPAVRVDDVGPAAVKLARSRRSAAPRLIAPRAKVAKAPIDSRAAFVLSLVDGRNTVDALVDMAAMPEEEVREILARLARLGLISLP